MPGVEFLHEAADDAGDSEQGLERRHVSPLILIAAVALALVVVGGVVIGNGGSHAPGLAVAARTPSRLPLPSGSHSTLKLEETQLFGPEAIDIAVTGNQVFALTPTAIGFADRDGGALTVRPAPLGLANQPGHGALVPDFVHGIVWVVAIGGTAIGSYDTDHLDTLSNTRAPYRINDAVALDEKLYFSTDHGLYTAEAGPDRPVRVPGLVDRLGAVSADPTTHEVVAAEDRSPRRVHVLMAYGSVVTATLPYAQADTIAATAGTVWIAGRGEQQASLFELNPYSLQPMRSSPLVPVLGSRAAIVASYGARLVVRGQPGTTLYCVDATNGRMKQKWTAAPTGAVALNQRGLLVLSGAGIEQLTARDCLA